jgi:hypothetical protein
MDESYAILTQDLEKGCGRTCRWCVVCDVHAVCNVQVVSLSVLRVLDDLA